MSRTHCVASCLQASFTGNKQHIFYEPSFVTTFSGLHKQTLEKQINELERNAKGRVRTKRTFTVERALQCITSVIIVYILHKICSTMNAFTNKQNLRIETGKPYTMTSTMSPIAKKVPHVTEIHNHTRIDNYHWMRLTDIQKHEKKDQQTNQVLQYIEEENKYRNAEFSGLKSVQTEIYNEIIDRIQKDDISVPYFSNEYFYYRKFEGQKEYPLYCRKKHALNSKEEVFLDVNLLSGDHAYISVPDYYISPDNKYVAYAVDTIGRRLYSLSIKNIKTGKVLEHSISYTAGDLAWANDSQTVFYTLKHESTLLSDAVYRHNIYTDSNQDQLIYKEKNTTFYNGVYRSKSGKYIIIYNTSTLVSDYQLIDANNPHSELKNFTPRLENHEYSIEHYNRSFYIITNENALNNKLMKVSDNNTNMSEWEEIVPAREHVHLLNIEVFKNYIVLSERKDGLLQLRVIGAHVDFYIDFEEPIYATNLSMNKEFDTEILRYEYDSLITPTTTVDYNMRLKSKNVLKQQTVVGNYEAADYKSELLYSSTTAWDSTSGDTAWDSTSGDAAWDSTSGETVAWDSTCSSTNRSKTPIYLVFKKELKKETVQPLLLYGYGSYGSTEDPYFSSTRLSLLDRGFIFAIANVRGSQIYGKQSYNDGKMLNKKNSFTDFIQVAKSLIAQGYTDRDNLFCMGGSAGGLLISTVLNMEPTLWKGAISSVPFVDVVTTMLDPTVPLTSNEWDEWGNPSNETDYRYMLSYSPYDQIRRTEYPNLLVTSGFFDSQVQYWEPLKYVAKLREHWKGKNKLYLFMNMDTGHGGKSGRFEQYDEVAFEYVFLLKLAGRI